MIKAADIRHGLVQGVLAGMAEWGVAEVMGERDSLDEVFIQAKRARERASDLRHFKAVGEACAVVIALVVEENLGFMNEPPERRRMHNAVAVALIDIAGRAGGFVEKTASALLGMRSVRG